MASVPLPEGFHSVNPYLVVDDAVRFIEFLVAVFAGTEQGARELTPDGLIGHADVRIGDAVVMISDASSAYPARPSVLFAYTGDVDETYRTALAAGVTSILEPTDQPWGDRVGGFHDPFGNRWWVATHQRDFS
jgi:PhnB protein